MSAVLSPAETELGSLNWHRELNIVTKLRLEYSMVPLLQRKLLPPSWGCLPWRWRQKVLPNHWYISTKLHSVITRDSSLIIHSCWKCKYNAIKIHSINQWFCMFLQDGLWACPSSFPIWQLLLWWLAKCADSTPWHSTNYRSIHWLHWRCHCEWSFY
jgi:hypothetical protein